MFSLLHGSFKPENKKNTCLSCSFRVINRRNRIRFSRSSTLFQPQNCASPLTARTYKTPLCEYSSWVSNVFGFSQVIGNALIDFFHHHSCRSFKRPQIRAWCFGPCQTTLKICRSSNTNISTISRAPMFNVVDHSGNWTSIPHIVFTPPQVDGHFNNVAPRSYY